jgi:tetratricopeptide (TPR) repeat protein
VRRALSLLIPFSACLTLGCATVERPAGTGWSRAQSPNFEVITDLSPEDARAAALDLERYRAALLANWKQPGLATPPTRMVVYSDSSDFREHGAGRFEGFFRQDRGERLLVEARRTFTQEGLGLAKTSAHELAHEIDAAFLQRMPRWVNEGLASYFSTVTVKDKTAHFGRAPLENLQWIQVYKPLGLEALFGWDELDPSRMDRDQLDRYYVWSWGWISYLSHEHPAQMADFLARLGRAEKPRQAFTAAFGPLDDAKTATAIRSMCQRIVPDLPVPLTAAEPRVEVTAITPAEYHAVEAEVWSAAPGTVDEKAALAFARSELDKALAAEPANPDALTLLAKLGQGPERISSARRLTEITPHDGRAWLLLVDALSAGGALPGERDEAFGKAQANAGEDPYVLRRVAEHVLSLDVAQGLSLAQRAVERAPYDLQATLVLDAALIANGRCEEARASASRALELVPERAPKEARDQLAQHLAQAAAGCQP